MTAPVASNQDQRAEPASGAPVASDLYQQIVLAHSREPRNFRRLPDATHAGHGHNRLCGDKVSVYLQIAGPDLVASSFEATGCAICLASASLLTEAVTGRGTRAASELADGVLAALDGSGGGALPGEIAALSGVRQYPSRVRCATLPWQAFRQALHQATGKNPTGPAAAPVSTEPPA